MPGSHKDSKSGDIEFVGISQSQLRETESSVTSILHTASVKPELDGIIEDAYQQLPAIKEAKTSIETINWLGSSYSGVDIKVIAHLYKPTNSPDDRIAKLNAELLRVQSIEEGCKTLLTQFSTLAAEIGDKITWDLKRDLFTAATGLNPQGDDPEQQAISAITSLLYQANFKTVVGIAFLRRRIETLRDTASKEKDALQDSVDTIEKLLAKGGNGQQTVVLATLQTISVQSHREKFAVRALGHSYAKGYTRGQRTIAGSMIFTVFNEHALAELQRAMGDRKEYITHREISTLLPDQLPPIDLTIVFANEYGHLSELRLYGVEFVNDGITFSIEDLLSENVMQFVARDADVLTDKGKVKLSRLQRGVLTFEDSEGGADSGSDLLDDENYKRYLDKIGIRRRLKGR